MHKVTRERKRAKRHRDSKAFAANIREATLSWLHVIFAFLFIKFALLLSSGILVLLVLRNKVVHVTFCFCELHLVHALTGVPMQECLTTEHRCEKFCHTFEHL